MEKAESLSTVTDGREPSFTQIGRLYGWATENTATPMGIHPVASSQHLGLLMNTVGNGASESKSESLTWLACTQTASFAGIAFGSDNDCHP
jgi:hypothetical protein